MSLNARFIAFDGVAFGALQIAFDGLRPAAAVAIPDQGGSGAPPQRFRPSSRLMQEDDEILAVIAIALQFMN